MKNIEFIKRTCAVLFLVTQTGCIYESHTITGKVVDESYVEISNVSVTVCYSGWEWSSNGLVWDKDYCSDAAMTDNAGVYAIKFNGPTFMRLMARKEGWIQRQSFNSLDSLIVLTKLETYLKREAIQREQREKEFKKRQTSESNADYYCRVILNRSGKVILNYIDQKIMVFQNLMTYEEQLMGMFAVKGSYEVASAFANEVKLRIDRKEIDGVVHLRTDKTDCPKDIFLLEVKLHGSSNESSIGIEILVPSAKALFNMNVWDQENS